MKRATAIILSWLLIGVFPAFVFAPPANAATFTAASCSAADVLTAIGLASNGDTVLVPGGTCTWDTSTNKVTLTKQITLSGQGTTSINFGGSGTNPGGNALSMTAGAANNTFITGFNFVGSYINGGCPIGLGTGTLTFRFYGNTLSDGVTNNPATIICVSGLGPGLIDHNVFTTHESADEVIHNLGINDGTGWTTDVVPGGPNMIFIEDNTFSNSTPHTDSSAVQAYNGARTVFRHNTLGLSFFVDQHAGGSASGARWWEVYGNSFNVQGNSTYNQSTYADLRGGSGVIWGNNSTGNVFQTTNLPGINIGPLPGSSDPQTGPWPINWQIGRGINETYSPAYIWGNPTFLNPTPGSENASYVQIGATPSSASCAANGTTGHPANVCDAVFGGTSQPSSLLRCESAADVTAGCPVSYSYVPYTYPHPLTGTVAFTLQPNPLAFGSQQISTQSASLTVTVTNTGTATGTLGSPYYTLGGANPGDFLNTGGSCSANGTVPPGSNCTGLFALKPTAAGARSATLTIGGVTINLTGTGTAPAIPVVSLAPRVINFNTVNTGTTSGNQTVTLTNTGTATLTISSISDSSPGVFPMNSNTCGASLAPSVACTFNVQFAPIIAGLQTATISISTNASTSPDTVSLSGTGFVVPVNTPPAPAVNLVATLKGINRRP